MEDHSLSIINQMRSLQDKVVLLVGGARQGGVSLAESLAERGADIAIVYFGENKQSADKIKRSVSERGQRCLVFSIERDGSYLPEKLVKQIINDMGGLDIFIDYGAPPITIANVKKTDQPEEKYSWSNPFSNLEMMSAALKQMSEDGKPTTNKQKIGQGKYNMRIAKEFVNKPIFSIKEGKELGKVQDIYLDQTLNSVTAIDLGTEGLLNRKETLIKWNNVVTLGPDVLLVKEAESVQDRDQVGELKNYVKREDLIGRPIDTPGGTKIGRIGDIVIDQDASVAGFRLSQTFVSGPVAENRAISRTAILDIGNEDGVMTAELSKAEEADLKVVYEGLFGEPTVTPLEEESSTET